MAWWSLSRHRGKRSQTDLPSDVVAAYARLLIAEREMRDSRVAADAAAWELSKLIEEKGLASQIDDQSQWSTLLEATARRRAERYESLSRDFDEALAAAGFPSDWTPQRARELVEHQLMPGT
ncbi:hypothetical protein C0Z11_01030 [Acidipropionibacterium jensenii]|uniref:hypothetical protein n=1 Tax=Acidipropionibacterium jensenii TaxID=1749 RepID=UPI000BC30AEC|nr:hypothetical protein [Acidipropionibacterium jensenii]AZZ41101.1 hypothetical protein C0Z11_01030 [Acidipropionibacterium jensenii]